MRKLVVLLVVITYSGLSIGNANLDRAAKTFAKAMMEFDFSTIAKLSHPLIVKANGGQDKYSALLKKNYENPRKNGLQFKDFVFKQAFDVKRYGNITLATVPYSIKVMYWDKGESASSYYYAFAGPKGLAWFFMDCNGVSEQLLKKLVRGFDNKIKKPGAC